jgi:methylated-DNA-protein-cysteine methyltransferase related protein
VITSKWNRLEQLRGRGVRSQEPRHCRRVGCRELFVERIRSREGCRWYHEFKGLGIAVYLKAHQHKLVMSNRSCLLDRAHMAIAQKTPKAISKKLILRITKDGTRANSLRDAAFRRVILSIPKGKVATYGQVAAAAGYPLYHRAVARLLRTDPAGSLPWQRVIGAGGEIKLRFEAGAEQRLRLAIEGVKFRGRKVHLAYHQHAFRIWELEYF